MTTPFPFSSGAVLTAAQMNAITTLPINDQTASYTLVVGDVGKRVVMNVASANTVTVDDSIFGVGDTIFIANKGAGATTVTAGAGVTINTAGSLVIAQHGGGTLVATSASVFTFFPSGVSGPQTLEVEFLVVAGGGGGGFNRGGAGGGGGFFIETADVPVGTYTVTVGGGGAASSGGNGSRGGQSDFSGIDSVKIFALGGGGGCSVGADNPVCVGGSGAGNGRLGQVTGLNILPYQGNTGGICTAGTTNASGGGGGASAVGGDASGSTGGNGGAGTANSFTGSSLTYSSGGGGGSFSGTAGTGGTNAGNGSANDTQAASASPANRGCGGGGGGAAVTGGNGGAGSSGQVVIRYLTADAAPFSISTTGTVTTGTDGSYTFQRFDGTGTLVVA